MTRNRDIVITGLGVTTVAGPSADDYRAALEAGGGAFVELPEPLQQLSPGFGGVVARDPKLFRQLPGTRPLRPSTMTRYTYLSTVGLGLTMTDAGIDPEPADAEAIRRSLFVGSYVNLPEMKKYVGMSYLVRDRERSAAGEYAVDDGKVMEGMKRFTAFEFLRLMNNMPVAHGAIQTRSKGPCNTFMGFCNAGLQAVGAGLRAVDDGLADLALCGGAGTAVLEHALTFKAYRGLMSGSADPATACRPFSRSASGIVPGEGAAFFALEPLELATARGARPRARLLSVASGFAPPREARGYPVDASNMAATLRAALDDAGLEPPQVDLLVTTGYGLPRMDELELAAYRDVFGDHLDSLRIEVHTPVTGFCEASHGTLGLAAAALALDGGRTGPGWYPDDAIDGYPAAAAGPGTGMPDHPTHAVATGFSMEGSCAAAVLARMDG